MSVKVAAKQNARQDLALTTYAFQDPKDGGGGGQSVQPRVWNSSTLKRQGSSTPA